MTVSRAVCPGCGAGLKSPTGFIIGQSIRCPRCKEPFQVEEPAEDLPPAEPPKPPGGNGKKPKFEVVADDAPRPKKKRPRDDDDEDDDRPKKKKKKKKGGGGYSTSPARFVVVGGLLVVLGVLSFFLYQKIQRDRETERANNAPRATNPDDDDPSKPLPTRPGRDDTAPPNPTPPRRDTTPLSGVVSRPKAMIDENHLRQIGAGLHAHADTNGALPAAAICDPSGRPLLSWRVAVLPYIEQAALHQEFRLNEPWDSPHNKPLLAKTPRPFVTPGAPDGYTAIKAFVGNGAAFDLRKGRRLVEFPDGTSNTLLAAAGGEAVPWTKPEDFAFDPNGPLPDLSPWFGTVTPTLLADGSVRRANLKTMDPKTVKALITAGGGEVVDNWP